MLICVVCGARSGEGVCLRVPVIQLLYVPWAVPACLSASPGERVTPLHLILLSAALLSAGQIQYIQIVPREKCWPVSDLSCFPKNIILKQNTFIYKRNRILKEHIMMNEKQVFVYIWKGYVMTSPSGSL